jgi:hypothetical protein
MDIVFSGLSMRLGAPSDGEPGFTYRLGTPNAVFSSLVGKWMQQRVKRSAMMSYGISAATPTQSPAIAAQKRRIQERIKGHVSKQRSERPTIAYYIVYFTTCALLLTLCVVAAFR